ncbi:ankyrin repeat domain-containing protein [Vibrio owensii]|uniref:ankyrin repeat domain-containing protein n=1 Tax=Vibrio owensii TaxID=696485 RepID=UPI003AAC3367
MNLPALHQSIVDNHYEQFVGLIEQGADVNQLDPVMGNAPLHIAAQQSSTQWVSKLLESGAFINLQTPKHGVTPLMVAVWHGHTDAAKALIEAGAEVALKGFDGKTPLGLAKEYHYAEIVELLENK